MSKKKYGRIVIKRYLVSDHYHIITYEFDDMYISVGLTSNNPNNKRNQKLHIVFESNGKTARLKNTATVDKKNKYSKKNANFTVGIETEEKALAISKSKKEKINK